MKNYNREQVKQNFTTVCNKIEEIEKSKPVKYITDTKYVPKIGLITDVTTIKDIVKLQSIVDEHKSTFNGAAIKLGIDQSELKGDDETTFMGFTLDVWDTDIKNRLKEIKQNLLLEKLKTTKKVLKKHLSDDDKFALDMESIGEVLSLNNID